MMQPEQAHATRRGVVGRGLLILAKKNLDSFSLWGDMMMMGVVSTGLLHSLRSTPAEQAPAHVCTWLGFGGLWGNYGRKLHPRKVPCIGHVVAGTPKFGRSFPAWGVPLHK